MLVYSRQNHMIYFLNSTQEFCTSSHVTAATVQIVLETRQRLPNQRIQMSRMKLPKKWK